MSKIMMLKDNQNHYLITNTKLQDSKMMVKPQNNQKKKKNSIMNGKKKLMKTKLKIKLKLKPSMMIKLKF